MALSIDAAVMVLPSILCVCVPVCLPSILCACHQSCTFFFLNMGGLALLTWHGCKDSPSSQLKLPTALNFWGAPTLLV